MCYENKRITIFNLSYQRLKKLTVFNQRKNRVNLVFFRKIYTAKTKLTLIFIFNHP